jgi:hypothetical protein
MPNIYGQFGAATLANRTALNELPTFRFSGLRMTVQG